MSVGPRICLVGSTGLVGRGVIARAAGRDDVQLVGIARREIPLPRGARMEMILADTSGWDRAISATRANVLVCALGTTMRQVGGDREAFRAVDHDLVLDCARSALSAGIEHAIVVSSVGADAAARSFYLRTKGETETALAKLGFRRLDILRPGLLLGRRNESRPLEKLGMMLAPVMNALLHGSWRKYRAIPALTLADAMLALAGEKARGRFVHDYDAIHRAIRRAEK